MEALKGKFERVSADNYEELLKELSVGWLLRKAALASTPVVEITEEDDVWSIKSSTSLKTVELKFKVSFTFILQTFIKFTSSWAKSSLRRPRTGGKWSLCPPSRTVNW